MKPQKQLIKHDPENGKFGDCHRTCIAALLDKDAEEVPNFSEGISEDMPTSDFWDPVYEYLETQGLTCVSLPFHKKISSVLKLMKLNNPGIYYIMGVVSPVGPHSIICCGDEMVCDPAEHPGGVDSMETHDGWVFVELLVPIGMSRR